MSLQSHTVPDFGKPHPTQMGKCPPKCRAICSVDRDETRRICSSIDRLILLLTGIDHSLASSHPDVVVYAG